MFVDGTVVRAHQHAAGAPKKGASERSTGVAAGSAPRSTSGSSGAASRSSRPSAARSPPGISDATPAAVALTGASPPPMLVSSSNGFTLHSLCDEALVPNSRPAGSVVKIAYVSQPWNDVLPPVQGGSIPVWTYDAARRLARSCAVSVYARSRTLRKEARSHEGVHYRYLPMTLLDLPVRPLSFLERLLLFPTPKRPVFAQTLYYLGYAVQVARDVRRERYDVVHVHNFSQFIPIIRFYNPTVKIVLHMHCEWLTQIDPALIESRLRQVDLIVGPSDYITDKIRRAFPQFAKRCHTIYNAVDSDRFLSEQAEKPPQSSNTKTILFVGRISPEKGLHVLLDGFEQVVRRYPQTRLRIAGPVGAVPFDFMVLLGDDEKVTSLASFYSRVMKRDRYFFCLQRRISSQLASRVEFLGPVPHSDLRKLYRDSDLFVLPSVCNEAFGIPLVEAMACELAVVSTRSGGATEIVKEGITGLLVERGDPSLLSDAIIRLLEDDAWRASMGRAGRQRVLERFGWERIAEEWLRAYHHLCEKR